MESVLRAPWETGCDDVSLIGGGGGQMPVCVPSQFHILTSGATGAALGRQCRSVLAGEGNASK